MKKQITAITNTRFNIISKSVLAVLGLAILLPLVLPASGWSAGLLKSVSGQDDGVSIRSHKVDVVINNGFSVTEVDQVFANSRDRDMEAVYSFPLPKQASLSELSLWIDGREVVGEVLEQQRARQVYEQQRDAGNQTALAEKKEFKTFDISIGNVPAGGDVRVRLVYLQPIDIDLNIGRYLYPLAEGNVDDERIAFWSVDDQVDGAFQFNLQLKSAFPVKDVRVPGFDQDAVIQQLTVDDEASTGYLYNVAIDKPEGANLARDIIFYYRLDDSVPARIEIIPYKSSAAEEGTFMAVVTPGADLQRISEGTDWTFVLDVSGSMAGGKLASLTKGVGKVLGEMNPNDRFRIVTFSDRAADVTGGFVSATPEHVQNWISRVAGLQSGGGTALYAGLAEGLRRTDADRTTGLVLVTDGVANIGPTEQSNFDKLVHEQDIRVFTFVIGNSANQPLVESIALESGGFAMNISESDDIVGRLLQAKAKVLHESIYDVALDFSGEKVHSLTPQRYGNLYMGEQMVIFGRYNGAGQVALEFSGEISGERKVWTTRTTLPDVATDNPELERLWALAAIDEKMQKIRSKGETETLKSEVVALATGYSLVTDYTSMVVVREEVFEEQGMQRHNAQRVETERKAREQRVQAPIQNHQVDQSSQTFGGRRSSGIGSGPVGGLFVGALAWLSRRRNSR